MKGITATLNFVMLIVIVVVSIAFVLLASNVTLEAASSNTEFRVVENIMKEIDNSLTEIEHEGLGSLRIVSFSEAKKFEVIPEEDSIQFKGITTTGTTIEYFSRIFKGNMIFIGGNDVKCSEKDGNADNITDIVLENSFITAVFQRVPKQAPASNIDTSYNIVQITEKKGSTVVVFENSSIVIDDNVSSYRGIGYSEIEKADNSLPVCTVHFYVNATAVAYDVFYRLYAGADFLTAEVRNR
ncbi:hypothetical protein HYZ41_00150 [archaeon]|nr:hypothetical protein [archaeon]